MFSSHLTSRTLFTSLSLALLSACIIQVPESLISSKPSTSPSASSLGGTAFPVNTALPTATPLASAIPLPTPFPATTPSPIPVSKRVYNLVRKDMVLWGGASLGEVPITAENTPVYRMTSPINSHELVWKEGELTCTATDSRDLSRVQKSRMLWNAPPDRLTEGDVIPMTAAIDVIQNNPITDYGAMVNVTWNVDGTMNHYLITRYTENPVEMNINSSLGRIEGINKTPIVPPGDHFTLDVNAKCAIGLIVRYQYEQQK